MSVWTEFFSVRIGPVAGFCGLGNDLGCKRGKNLNHLRDLLTYLLKKDSASLT